MRINYEEEVGRSYGRLTFIKFLYRNEKGKPICRFSCSCDGHEVDLDFYAVRCGTTRSCGCYKSECLAKRNNTHGKHNSPIYPIWKTITQRCYNSKNKDYKYYGGAGVKMSDLWYGNFQKFYDDMIDSYNEHVMLYGRENTSLDRIDPNGDYCKENCRWATWKEQNNFSHKRNFKDNTEVTNVIKETLVP